MSDTSESYDDEAYYDDLAEAWDERGGSRGGSSSGGGGTSKKKKAPPTTVGRMRVGGTQAWGISQQVCGKGCKKKCCSGADKKTPTM
jgi:hypothetical protein